MKNFVKIIGILFLLSVSSNLLAQGFTFHGTMAFPQTDFKNDKISDSKSGFANIGFGGGIEFLSAEMGKKFYWIGSLNYIHHGVGDDLYHRYDDIDTLLIADQNLGDISLTAYNCFALVTGVRFKNMFDRKKKEFGMYIDGQLGVGLVYVPDYDYTSDDGSVSENINMDFSNSFVFSIGAGFVLWSKVLIGVKYVNFLTPEFAGTYTINDVEQPDKFKFKQSISTISLNFGFTFQN